MSVYRTRTANGQAPATNVTARAPRVCIVTPAHLASNPRVVKEADALQQAGFRVRVVFAQGASQPRRQYDHKLTREREWSACAVHIATRRDSPLRWTVDVLTQRVLQRVPPTLWPYSRIVEHAESRAFRGL